MNNKLFVSLLYSLYMKKFSATQKIITIFLITKIIECGGKYQSSFLNLMYDSNNTNISQKLLKEKLKSTDWFDVKIFPGKKNSTTFYLTDKGLEMLSDSGVILPDRISS